MDGNFFLQFYGLSIIFVTIQLYFTMLQFMCIKIQQRKTNEYQGFSFHIGRCLFKKYIYTSCGKWKGYNLIYFPLQQKFSFGTSALILCSYYFQSICALLHVNKIFEVGISEDLREELKYLNLDIVEKVLHICSIRVLSYTLQLKWFYF